MLAFALLASLASVLPIARAHGYIDTLTTSGGTFSGYLPYQDPYYTPPPDRVVRKIPGNGPVTDLSLIDVQCNGYTDGGVVGSAPAALVAPVTAGSQVQLHWTTWPDSHMGPLITYMAKVPTGSNITSWSPGTSKVWFKVAESGKTGTGTTNWASTTALTASGSVYTFTVPSYLASGQYIIRHEIIALHAAYEYPGAQVYPSCIQVQVTGSGTKTPSSSYLVAFPGAYTATTPGIVYDAYTNTSAYPIPGPTLWTGA